MVTVLDVLRKIGSHRFCEINQYVQNQRLVSFGMHCGYDSRYIKEVCKGWYYLNQSDADTKYIQLQSINRELNLNLHIEIGENFMAKSNPKTLRTTSRKHKLKVTMADGEVIDYDGPGDVFMACIDKLGPRKVSGKANIEVQGSALLTSTTTS